MAYAHLADELTADWLRTRYLYGIDLTDDAGVAYPESLYETAIAAGIETIENALDLVRKGMRGVTGERRDLFDWSPGGYHLQMLEKRPVRSVTALSLRWGQYPPSALPSDWIHIANANAGQVQIVPSGNQGVGPIGLPGGLIGAPWVGHDTHVPGLQVFDYVAGFESQRFGLAVGTFSANFSIDGPIVVRPSQASGAATYTALVTGIDKATGASGTETLTWTGTIRERKQTAKSWSSLTSVALSASAGAPTFDVSGTNPTPADLLDLVGIVASMLPLDTAGDLIAGAGIATTSISLDGISQSVGTTASATNSGYGARVIQYRKRLEVQLLAAQSRWKPTLMGAI